MRIGFDAKRYFHNQTGLGNYARSLIKDLSEFSTDVSLFLFDAKVDGEAIRLPESTEVVRPKGNKFLWRQIGIANQIESLNLDIYHGLSAELPMARPRNTKLVVTIHDIIFLKYPAYYRFFDRLIYTYKLRHALQSADKVICASEKTKNDIVEIFLLSKDKLHVIYQTCDERFYNHRSEADKDKFKVRFGLSKKYIVCVSKFEKRKNHGRLMEAYKSIASSYPYDLVLVGRKGDTFESVTEWIRNSGLSDRIKIMNEVSIADLPLFYQCAELSIFPSEYEGFGIPVLESMASGTPVLTSQNSSMSEISGNYGNLFNPLSVSSMVDVLLKAPKEEFMQVNRESLDEHLASFSAQSISNQHINLYKSLL